MSASGMSWPPARTRAATRATCSSALASPMYQTWTSAPCSAASASRLGIVLPPSVLSNAKSMRSSVGRSRAPCTGAHQRLDLRVGHQPRLGRVVARDRRRAPRGLLEHGGELVLQARGGDAGGVDQLAEGFAESQGGHVSPVWLFCTL